MQQFQQIEDVMIIRNGETELRMTVSDFLHYEPEYLDCRQKGMISLLWTPEQCVASDGKRQWPWTFDGTNYLTNIQEYQQRY